MIDAAKFHWGRLSQHEKTMASLCIALLAFALFWSAAAKPALRSIESSKARIAKSSAQLAEVKAIEAQAQALRVAKRASRDDAARGIEAAASLLPGKATARANGSAMSVEIEGATAMDIHQFIASARKAGSMPDQADLTRDKASGLWSGTFDLRLPKEAP